MKETLARKKKKQREFGETKKGESQRKKKKQKLNEDV